MPTLKFKVPYASREGHCPNCDGWSFHHVLPVRYFWSAAYILVKLLRLQECRNSGKKGDADLKAEFGTPDALDFFGEFDAKRADILAACLSLHRNPGNNNAKVKLAAIPGPDLSSVDVIRDIVGELTGPKYGGFAGMAPDQRLDDPSSALEKKKPSGLNPVQWEQLMDLAIALQRCIPKIAGETNGPFDCQVSGESAVELLHCLRILRDRFSHSVYDFRVTDWSLILRGKSVEWNFLGEAEVPVAGDPHQIGREGVCGKVFRLDDETFGFAIKKGHLGSAGNQSKIVARSTADRTKVQFVKRV